MTDINVAIIEDNRLYRQTLVEFLSETFVCNVHVESVEDFLCEVSKDAAPDVVLMDIELPGMSGIQGMGIIKERFPGMKVFMITAYSRHS